MKKLAFLLVALLSLSGIFAPTANALRFVVVAEDQPYYIHGPGYWANGVYWVWYPGYWGRHHVWVRGHYGRR